MMPFTIDDGPATAYLVVRSWQQRLDLFPGLVRQLARPLKEEASRGRRLAEAELIRQTGPS